MTDSNTPAEKPPLEKPVHVTGPDGLWGLFNTPEWFAASRDGYLLTMSPARIRTLDDFTPAQERGFWDFTFDRAAAGTHDTAQRGHETIPAEAPAQCAVVCLLNDGPAAWQAVGSVHGHVVWIDPHKAPADLQAKITQDRTRITGSANPYMPLGSIEVDLRQENYSDNIRAARRKLSETFTASAEKSSETLSFALYTKTAASRDPRQECTMVIEAWSPDHHAVASASGFARSWFNPQYPNPVSPHKMGYQYPSFVPKSS